MNPVHATVLHPIDGGTEGLGLSALMVATLAIAMFVVGGVTFYSVSGDPPAVVATSSSPVAEAFQALEAFRLTASPPTTTGQGSRQFFDIAFRNRHRLTAHIRHRALPPAINRRSTA